MPHAIQKQKYDFNKLEKRLVRKTGEAIVDYQMIREGDRVMVCLSGGKDSYTLLEILLRLQKTAPINFSIRAVNLDQKQPGFPEHILPDYLKTRGVEYDIIEEDTYSTVERVVPAGKTMCGLCSRLRRGILYRYASENGMTKIALGHHGDDILETLFLNLFHGSRLKAMPPKLLSDDHAHIVIRPLAYCREKDIAKYSEQKAFPIIPCNLCGSQTTLQRVQVKKMLADFDAIQPGRTENMLRGLQNVSASHLMDRTLFDFEGLEKTQAESNMTAA